MRRIRRPHNNTECIEDGKSTDGHGKFEMRLNIGLARHDGSDEKIEASGHKKTVSELAHWAGGYASASQSSTTRSPSLYASCVLGCSVKDGGKRVVGLSQCQSIMYTLAHSLCSTQYNGLEKLYQPMITQWTHTHTSER